MYIFTLFLILTNCRLTEYIHGVCISCFQVSTLPGFKPLPFDANEDHYGCQVPEDPLTRKVRKKYNIIFLSIEMVRWTCPTGGPSSGTAQNTKQKSSEILPS